MTEPRLGKRERTRAQIVNSATELLNDETWDSITLEDIAERAGLVRTTVFNHFRVKDEILHAACDDTVRSIEIRGEAVLDSVLSDGSRFHLRTLIFDTMFKTLYSRTGLSKLFLWAFSEPPGSEPFVGYVDRLVALTIKQVDSVPMPAALRGTAPRDDQIPFVVAEGLVLLALQAISTWPDPTEFGQREARGGRVLKAMDLFAQLYDPEDRPKAL